MALDGGVSVRNDRMGMAAGGGKADVASHEGGAQQAASGSPLEVSAMARAWRPWDAALAEEAAIGTVGNRLRRRISSTRFRCSPLLLSLLRIGAIAQGPVWVEARASCAHIHAITTLGDLPSTHALCKQYASTHPRYPSPRPSCTAPALPPLPPTPHSLCGCAADNWVCLSCGEVACGRSEGAHMVKHFYATGHPLAAGFRDSSVWCFQCDSYLDALRIPTLRPLFHSLYRSKSGQYSDLSLHSHAHSPTSASASATASLS
ncbi:unnamed protein product [Closterium sp. Naga37s-1]|nr:unnamed protein product [Closterium sp. Naga37s-1]